MKTPMYIVALCNELEDNLPHIETFVYCYTWEQACLAGNGYVQKYENDFGVFAWYNIYKLTK